MRAWPVSLLVFAFVSLSLSAQTTTGDISGTVKDSTGAVVPGVTVVLTDLSTNATSQALTDENGDYIFNLLKPGRYSISAEKPGFQKHTISDAQLLRGNRIRVDVTLQVGAVQEVVEVVGGAVLLESQSANLGQVIEEKRIKDLPLNGRNFMPLAHMSVGVIPLGNGNSPATGWTGRGDQSASISGQRETACPTSGHSRRKMDFGSMA